MSLDKLGHLSVQELFSPKCKGLVRMCFISLLYRARMHLLEYRVLLKMCMFFLSCYLLWLPALAQDEEGTFDTQGSQ